MSINLMSFVWAILYLGGGFVGVIFFLQYKWAKICDKNIQVLVAQSSGGGKFLLTPKDSDTVSFTNPNTGDTRTWSINELATIEVPYPGVGFVPKWLQKTIRMGVVDEGDWEPVLNRSPHRRKVASPDVISFLKDIMEDMTDEPIKQKIASLLPELSSAPSREMIADPSMLGNLMRTTVLKSLAQVSDELTDALKKVSAQLSRIRGVNPTIVYIGLAMIFIFTCVILYKEMQSTDISMMAENIERIMDAQGIIH